MLTKRLLTLLLGVTAMCSSVMGQLSGTYTVGGTSPNYPTLDSAISDLTTKGVSGATVFKIRQGTYNTAASIGSITGASSTNTIEFVADQANTSAATITYASTTSGANYTWQFNGAKHVTVDSLTIVATGATYGRVISFSGLNENVTISNCIIKGVYTETSTSTNLVVIYDNSGTANKNTNITISNNEILNGSYGIYMYGPGSTNFELGGKITNNTIKDYRYYGVYSSYQANNTISGNTISDNNKYTSPYGLRVYYNDTCQVYDNELSIGGTSSPYGIYFYYCDGSATKPAKCYNNSINMYNSASTGSLSGIYAYQGSNNEVYYNSVRVAGAGTGARALYFSYSTGDNALIKNNNLSNLGGGYAVYASTNSGLTSSDYNNLYTSGTNIGYWSGARTDLAAYKTASSQETNSVSANPFFKSTTDLTPKNGALDNSATVLSGYTTDIKGTTRNASTPDMGAFEFAAPGKDAGVSGLVSSSFCPGTGSITAILVNYGNDTLKSATVNWTAAVNSGAPNTQTPASWTGSLLIGDTAHVNLGNYTFASSNTYDFKFYSSSPNGGTDVDATNDTFNLNGIGTALSGTYTLGGTTPDFATFAAAVSTLNSNGLCGPVKIKVRQGTYTEQVNLTKFNGLSSTNTLEFVADQSNTSAAILTYAATGTAANYTVQFNATEYITIDSLEIVATGTSYARAVTFTGLNNNITISNNTISGVVQTSTTSSNFAVIFDNTGSANAINDVTISGNTINGGTYGIYLFGIGSTSFEQRNKIADNKITNYHYYGIYSYYQANNEISGNYIEDADSYTSPYGIRIYYNDTVKVFNNEVYVGGTSSPYGIYFYYCDGSASKPAQLYNNMVSMYNPAATGSFNGIYAYQGTNNVVYYNSVAVHGGSTSARALYFSYSTGDNAIIKNNSLANFGGGYAVYASSNSGLTSSDYNNLYASGTNVGYWSGARTDLAAYKTASSQETNSVSSNPVYYGSMDLRAKGVGINDKGNTISSYTTDLFGSTRSSTTPDIGAHEFTPPANDVGVIALLSPENNSCGDSSQNVQVIITNYGTASKTGVSVNVDITGSLSTTLSVTTTKTIATGESDTVSMGIINTKSGGTYNFRNYSLLSGDQDTSNDTLIVNGLKINGIPNTPTSPSATVCEGADTSLVATGSGVGFRWYDAMTGGTLLSSSDTLSRTNLTNTDTFYVETFNKATASLGATSNAIGSGGNYTSLTSDGLKFDAVSSFTLDSVSVYPSGTGNVKVTLQNSAGTTLQTKTVAVTGTGKKQIAVGFNVAAGTGYKLLATGTTTGGLYRNSGGATYPYSDAGGNVKITGALNGLTAYYYFFYDWKVTVNGCPSARSRSIITVNPLPVFTLGKDTAFCGGSGFSYTLDATTAGATYKWNDNSTNATLVATAAGTYSCEVTLNGCMSADTAVVGANPLPTVNFPNPSDLCANDTTITLSGATPTGGVYSGTNVNGGLFDPLAAGSGQDTLYYTYTDTIGCSAADTAYINVKTLPSVSVTSLSAVCANNNTFPLTNGLPTGGTYSGTGVISNSFSPDSAGVGSHKIIYSYTGSNGCSDTASAVQTVDSLPLVSFSLPNNWCLNSPAIKLNTGMPSGGNYFVNGTQDTMYSATTAGNDTVAYVFTDSNSCVGRDTAFITADTVPVISFTAISDACVGSSSISLTQGAPMGGTYSGNNVLGSLYNPSMVGMDTLMYSFTDSNNCVDSAAQTITVNALPNVSLASQANVCENTPSFALVGGTPAGGTYKGAGVSSGNYDASVSGFGTHTVVYVYKDGNNCSDSANTSIVVNSIPNVGLATLGFSCNNADAISLLSSGTPVGGKFSGVAISGNDFNPAVAGTGTHSVTYMFTDANNCSDSAKKDIVVEAAPVFSIVGDLVGCGVGEHAPVLKTTLTGMVYHWSNGSKVDSSIVLQNGDIWAKVTDPATNERCFSYDTVTVKYDDICVGINEVLSTTSVSYYPNPSNGTFNYDIKGFDGLDIEVTIITAGGQEFYRNVWNNVSDKSGEIQLNGMESGLYFINLATKNGSVMHRLTIMR